MTASALWAFAGCFSFGSVADTPYNRGVDAFDQKRYADAVRWFRRATELEPEDPRPRVNLAITFDRLEQPKLAEQHYRAALNLAPAEPRALANLGALLAEQGKDAEARRLLRAATAAEPSSAFTWIALGHFEERQGHAAAAADHYRTAIAAEPELPSGHYRLGRLLAAQGKTAAASDALRAALKADPEDVEATRALLALLPAGATGDGEAIALGRRLALLTPDDARVWLRLGECYARAGDHERALMALWQARDHSPRNSPLRPAILAGLRAAHAACGRALDAEPAGASTGAAPSASR